MILYVGRAAPNCLYEPSMILHVGRAASNCLYEPPMILYVGRAASNCLYEPPMILYVGRAASNCLYEPLMILYVGHAAPKNLCLLSKSACREVLHLFLSIAGALKHTTALFVLYSISSFLYDVECPEPYRSARKWSHTTM